MRWVLLLCLGLLTGCAGGGDSCRLGEPVAVLPLRGSDRVPVVAVEINGRPASLVIDTGSFATVLTRVAAARLGVAEGQGRRQVRGAGGSATLSTASVATLTLGGEVVRNKPVLLADAPAPPLDGLLGIDAMVGFELDLDVLGGRATFFRARPCALAQPPWPGTAVPLPVRMEAGSGHLFTPVRIDGDQLLGQLDTGASDTVLSLQSAGGLGVVRQRLEALPSGRGQAVNAEGVLVRSRRFGSLEVGPVRLRAPVLTIADLPPTAGDLLVGSDVIGRRRTWFAFLLGRVWMQEGADAR